MTDPRETLQLQAEMLRDVLLVVAAAALLAWSCEASGQDSPPGMVQAAPSSAIEHLPGFEGGKAGRGTVSQ